MCRMPDKGNDLEQLPMSEVNMMSELSDLRVWALVVVMAVAVLATPSASTQAEESLGWKPHFIRQGDGEGGWVLKPAECQVLRYRERGWSAGFGVAQMDNGDIVVLGVCAPNKSLWYGGGENEQTIIAFSSDRGNAWSELEPIPGVTGRPMMLAHLGGGDLTFLSGQRYFSSDYGRTWSGISAQPAINGGPFYTEGSPLVDRDEQGTATRLGEIGYNTEGGPSTSSCAGRRTEAGPGATTLSWARLRTGWAAKGP